MPISNFPNGFYPGVAIRGLPVLNTYGGSVFWVDSATGSNGNKGSHDQPFATLDYAIGRCTANKGDMILIKANHAETITGVGGITTDVAGITIEGLGNGDQRPRFLMDGAATVTWLNSAADVSISNVVLAAGHADIARAIHNTSTGLHLDRVEFVENVVDENFLIDVDCTSATANGNDGLHVTNCRSVGVDASRTEFIAVVEDLDGAVVTGNFVCQNGSTDGALIKQATGKDLTNLFCAWNFMKHVMTAGDLLIDNDTTANSGIIAHNRVFHADVTSTHSLIDCDGCGMFDNLSTSVTTASGFVLPAIDTDA